jgi:hypothetical protein
VLTMTKFCHRANAGARMRRVSALKKNQKLKHRRKPHFIGIS